MITYRDLFIVKSLVTELFYLYTSYNSQPDQPQKIKHVDRWKANLEKHARRAMPVPLSRK